MSTPAENKFEEMDGFTQAYLECAVWTSEEEIEAAGFDESASIWDFSPESILKAKADCKRFREITADAFAIFCKGFYGEEEAGHAFWLDRNRHGAGALDYQGVPSFKDIPGFEDACQALHDIAQRFGEQYVVVGDDGQLWLEGGNTL